MLVFPYCIEGTSTRDRITVISIAIIAIAGNACLKALTFTGKTLVQVLILSIGILLITAITQQPIKALFATATWYVIYHICASL